jgi:hypothetical protein
MYWFFFHQLSTIATHSDMAMLCVKAAISVIGECGWWL